MSIRNNASRMIVAGIRSVGRVEKAMGAKNLLFASALLLLLSGQAMSQATQILVETSPGGAGTVVPAQNLASNDTLRVYAITRTAANVFVGNVAATWSLDSLTGGMVAGDLVPSGDGKSALLRGKLVGSGRIRATSGVLTQVISGRVTIIPGIAAKLRISTEPSATATAGVVFAQQPIVRIEDSNGNLITTDNTTNVTAARLVGTGTLLGSLTRTAIGGLATFTDLRYTVAELINIRFTSSPVLTPDTSSNITVSPATASRIAFVAQPTNALAGTIITPAVTTQLQDAFGNTVAQSGTAITISLQSGTGSVAGTTVRTTSAGGLATFNDLSIALSGTKVLKANGTALDSATSSSFVISPKAAKKLTVRTQPSPSATAGIVFAQQPVVAVEDTFGNLVTTDNTTIVTASRNAGAGVLQGTANRTVVGGLATFTDLNHTVAGTINLKFKSAPTLDSTISNNIIIGSGVATKLVFAQQPTNAASGVAIAPPITVQLQDTFSNNVSTAAIPVLMALSSGTGVLSGTTTQNTDASGLATFANLSINLVGAKVLTASRSGLASAVSAGFTITVGPPATIVASSGTPQNAQVNNAFATNLQATVRDAAGNAVSGALVSFTKPAVGASGTFAGGIDTVRTNAGGVATAPVFTANTIAGAYSVTASVVGVAAPATYSLTNTTGPARKISATAGTPQSTQISTAFPVQMQATVRDSFDNVISGAVVRWTRPTSGPTGTFAGAIDSAITNASGVATAPIFIANITAGTYNVTATTSGITGVPATYVLTNLPGPPNLITAFAGANQSAQVGTAFAANLKAKVVDGASNPIGNVLVRFNKPASGASGTFAGGVDTVRTDASGIATAPVFTANAIAGSYNDSAVVVGASLSPAVFPLTNLSGAAGSITPTSGTTPQVVTVNTPFPVNLQVIVRDGSGNPVNNVLVTFTAASTGPSGRFPAGVVDTVRTLANGTAAARVFTANTIAGQYQVTASAPGVLTSAVFNLTNSPAAATRISATAGTPQSAVISTVYATPFKARVADDFGNPIRSVSVTFIAPSSGASGSFAGGVNTATTDSLGVATAQVFTANTTAGPFLVRAASAGTDTANYSLTNLSASASSITATGGTPQTAVVNNLFADSLRAIVRDGSGNVVANAAVTFTAPLSGASGKFSNDSTRITRNTSSLGVVAVQFRADVIAGGPYSVNATVSGVSIPALFSLRNLPGPPASIVTVAGTPQSAVVNRRYSTNFSARVRDTFGNAIGGASVTFSAPTSGTTGTFASGSSNTQPTDTTGVATASAFTANSISGPYAVTASVSGLGQTVQFVLRNLASSPARLTVVAGGTPQSTTVGTDFSVRLRVAVQDSFNNAVPSVTVTYAAPLSGASGTFTGGVNNATTDTLGIATPPAFRANTIAGRYSVTASVAGLAQSGLFTLTNSPAAPSTIVATFGTPQSAQVAQAFSDRFRVLVRDGFSNPIPNAVVTFTPPTTGPSGAFQGGVNTATTDSAGVAEGRQFTANTIAGGPYGLRVETGTLVSTTLFSLTNTAGQADSARAIAGTPDSTIVGTQFPRVKTVLVTDRFGNPKSGITVNFSAPATGASLAAYPTTLTTDPSGLVSVAWSANLVAGPYQVIASVLGVANPGIFRMKNLSSSPSLVQALSGTPQTRQIGTNFDPFRVIVKDQFSNPVPNASVTFTAPASGASGTFLSTGNNTAVVATNDSGIAASPTFRANSTAGGPYVVRASVPGVSGSQDFSLTNTSGAPGSIAIVAGNNQSALVGVAFLTRFKVRVLDGAGNPVPGTWVKWIPPTLGPSGSFASNRDSAITLGDGTAEAEVFTANTVAGASYRVSASAFGAVSPVQFTLQNLTRPARNSLIVAGGNQRTQVVTAFPVLFKVAVTDTFGNPIRGATVNFSPPPLSGPSGTFQGGNTYTTDSTGIATATTFIANEIANLGNAQYSLPYSVTGLGVQLPAFALGNTPRPANRIETLAGTTPQTAVVGRLFGGLRVRVVDNLSNPRSGDTVRFAAPLTGPSGTFPGGRRDTVAVTSDSGIAVAPPFTANTLAGGPYSVTASTPGVPTSASFSLTNIPSQGANITATGGTPQTTLVTQAFVSVLEATVRDSVNNPVPNVQVTFEVPATGASCRFDGGGNQFLTDQNGIAMSSVVRANEIAGRYSVVARIQNSSATAAYSLTNSAGSAATLTAIAGTGQRKQVGTPFDTALTVVVLDGANNPISGASVTFTAPDTGASGKFANGQRTIVVLTDSLGKASSSQLTADTVAGSYVVFVSVASVAQRDSFLLTNLPAALSTFAVEAQGGGPIAGQRTLIQFTVRISARDRYNNVATTFGDSVRITSTGQLLSGGGTTPRLVNGVLTRQIVIGRAASNVRITASRASGGTETGSSNAFQVDNPVPTLVSIIPDTARLLETLELMISGTNFIDTVTSVNVGSGITINLLRRESSTALRLNVTINPNAALGARPITVNNAAPGGGPSNARSFVVVLPIPQPPVLGGPVNGSRNNPTIITFAWSRSALASAYHLQVSTDSLFTPPIFLDDPTIADTTKTIGPLVSGIKYYWRVRALNGSGSGEFTGFKFFSTVPVYPVAYTLNTTIAYPTLAKPGDYSPTDYRLVGLPGNPAKEGRRLSEFLAGSQNVDWVVYRDNGLPGGSQQDWFVPFSASDDNFKLLPGRAFWILRRGNLALQASVPTESLDVSGSVSIGLRTGWNIITNPFATNVPLSELRALNGNFTEQLYSFSGVFALAQEMEPYKGYYFLNDPANSLVSLKVPFGVFGALPKRAVQAPREGEWVVNIEFVSNGFTDRTASFGVLHHARVGLDSLEYRKPRSVSGVPTVYFDRPEWDPQYSGFAKDFRPGVDEIETWTFDVASTSRELLRLHFDGIEMIPEQFKVFLVDEQRSRFIDLKREGSYEFRLPVSRSQFKVVVGKAEAVQQALSSVLPREFAMEHNYPNPFNPATTIPIAVPQTADVTVRVYSILGEEVRTVFSGTLEAGRHFLTWDGKNDIGHPVASGMYIARFTTNTGKAFTGKMHLIK